MRRLTILLLLMSIVLSGCYGAISPDHSLWTDNKSVEDTWLHGTWNTKDIHPVYGVPLIMFELYEEDNIPQFNVLALRTGIDEKTKDPMYYYKSFDYSFTVTSYLVKNGRLMHTASIESTSGPKLYADLFYGYVDKNNIVLGVNMFETLSDNSKGDIAAKAIYFLERETTVIPNL